MKTKSQTVTGRAVKKLYALPSDHQFEPLLMVDTAQKKLDSAIQSFFEGKRSTFLNVSTGLGKTRAVLKALNTIPSNKRVLVLVPNHDLAEEIVKKFSDLRESRLDSELERMRCAHSGIFHLKGKTNGMCEEPERLKPYLDAGVKPPAKVCTYCPKYRTSGCRYIEQFNSLKNIRVMTHNELVNEQSAWFYGNKRGDGSPPRKSQQKFDYIIVDEDWLQADNHLATFKSKFKSIGKIIDSLKVTEDLSAAIRKYETDVLDDYQKYENTQYPKFEGNRNYIQEHRDINAELFDLKILKAFYNYLVSGNDHEISRMFYDQKTRKLHYYDFHKTADRYSDVPTLFLDATANESLIKEVIGDIDFHSIKVKASDTVNVYQAENFNITKSWLENDKNISRLIKFINKAKENYQNVGFITYQNVSNQANFDDWLAAECGIETYGHFNKVRGLNKFENLDCLIVIGRQLIRQKDNINIAQAIYGERIADAHSTLDTPIRMKDGTSRSIGNYIYNDPRLESVRKHFSRAETLQSVGRARLIQHAYNHPKDIFILSKESLGSDLEVTKFVREEDILPLVKYESQANTLKQTGYCKNKPKELIDNLGLSKSSINKDRTGIIEEFLNAGIEEVVVSYKDKNRNPKKHSYFVSDRKALLNHIQKIGGSSIVVS